MKYNRNLSTKKNSKKNMKVKSSSKKNKVTLKKKWGGANDSIPIPVQPSQISEYTTDIKVKRIDNDRSVNLLEFQFQIGDAIESNDINDLCLENGQFKLIKQTQPENKFLYVLVFKINDSFYSFHLNNNFGEDEIRFPFYLNELKKEKLQTLEVFLKLNMNTYDDKGLEDAFGSGVKVLVFVVPSEEQLEEAMKKLNAVIEAENQKINQYKEALKKMFGEEATDFDLNLINSNSSYMNFSVKDNNNNN